MGPDPQGKGKAGERSGWTQEVTTKARGWGWGSASAAAEVPGSLSGPARPVGARTKFLLGLNVPS